MRKKLFLSLLLACALLGSASAAWTPADFAGGSLSGVAEAEDGTLLVSDVFNKVIWRVNADGSVEQAAGTINMAGLDGEPVGRREDGAAADAMFTEPWAIVPYREGWAITDASANVVRFFDGEKVVTAAGSGRTGSSNGFGTGVSFNRPTGLAVDPEGLLYVADTGNGSIRTVSGAGRVSTYATGLVEPTGLCWHEGALYVAETGRNRIVRIEGSKKEFIAGGGETVGDGYYPGAYVDGPVELARFDHPQGIAVASDGAVYVADTGNRAVRKISDGYVTTLAVSRGTPEPPVQPRGLLVQGDSLLGADLFARTLFTIDLSPAVYTDVPEDAWYAQAVAAATEYGITGGTGGGRFSPNEPVSRAVFTVMLSRVQQHWDGHAVINGAAEFADVGSDAWYGGAVRWAADQAIISGYNGRFAPDTRVTREQIAAMLWRFAGSPDSENSLEAFPDQDRISEYARGALAWAVEQGIMKGSDGLLDPRGEATRAQAVQMLIGFMESRNQQIFPPGLS